MSLKQKLNDLMGKTPQDKERAKRLIVYTLLCLSCVACLWLIFSPSGEDEQVAGKANMEIPEGTTEGLPDSKIKAYELDDMNKERVVQDSIGNALREHTDSINTAREAAAEDEIQNSAEVYQQVQASIQDFYVEPAPNVEMDALNERIAELEAQNAMAQQQAQQPDQMELLERSYQLAAQYMGNGNAPVVQGAPIEEKGKRDVQPVVLVHKSVVSSLASNQTVRGFNTSVGVVNAKPKNTISAIVAGDQSVIDGQSVKLRTTEPMWVGSQLIPRHTTIVGAARLQGERLEIHITSIESEGSIYEVELAVFDSDGQEGINIPNSMESDALHEIGANMGSTMGSSINISTDAGAQIASDVGRGLINGVSQYLTKKLRTVKVKLKSGYKVMLHQPDDI